VLEHHAEKLDLLAEAPRRHRDDRVLHLAGPAPARPEVQDDRLSLEVGELNGFAGVQPLQREVRGRLAPELEGNLVRIPADALSEDEEQHAGPRGEGETDPHPAPAHAAAPGLRASPGTGTDSAASARARRRSGQAAKSAPRTNSGRLHQIQDTIGKIQALKLAEGVLTSKASRVR